MADCMQLQEWPEPIVRVQALAESGLSVIPRCYVKPPCDRPAVVAPAAAAAAFHQLESDTSIPVVDLGELLAADGGAVGASGLIGSSAVTEAVASACREWGFFQVVNHGVRPELMRAAREAWRGFFRRPLVEKQRYANSPRTYEGYGSRLGVQKGAVLDWGDYFFLHLAPEAAKSTAKFWPAEPSNCKEVSEEYGREVVRLCELLMRVLSVSLGLDEAHFQRAFGGADCGATLRANYYPRCPQPDLTLGLSAHSDPGVLTVLLADEHVRGLQVRRDAAGEWVTVHPVHDAFIVNVGDQVQLTAVSAVNGTPRVDTSKDGNVFGNAEKMKGLLGSYYTFVEKLFVISGGIFLSHAYFLAQKTQGSVEDTWMVIFIGSFIASLINFILLIHASYLKESGSIDGFDYGILKWLLLLVLVFLYAVFCILLRAFASTFDLALWLFGMIGLCLILLGWVWFFYGNWPKTLEEMRACCVGENVPVSAGSASEEV